MSVPQYQGQSIPVVTIPPNWEADVFLRTIYATKFFEGLDTSEERHGRQPRCLYGLRYQTLGLSGQETGYIRRVLDLAQGMPVGIPAWTEAARLTAQANVGATTLAVDHLAPTLWEVLPDYVLIIATNEREIPIFNQWEVLQVTTLTDLSITLTEPTTRAWPVHSWALPLLIGRLPRAPHAQVTDIHGVLQVDFEERFHGLTDQSIQEAGTL
jgi:hypothetical protein